MDIETEDVLKRVEIKPFLRKKSVTKGERL